MAWTATKTFVAGAVLTASDLNTYLSDNTDALRTGALALASQAQGDALYASSSTQLARLAAAASQYLRFNAGATALESRSAAQVLSDIAALAADGSVPLTADWDAGAFEIRGKQLVADTDAPATPAADTIYGDSIIKAWASVSFSGGTPSIDDDLNVASLTDNGDGDTSVNFATNMANANYAAIAIVFESAGSQRVARIAAQAVGSVQVVTENSAGSLTDYAFNVIVVGSN